LTACQRAEIILEWSLAMHSFGFSIVIQLWQEQLFLFIGIKRS